MTATINSNIDYLHAKGWIIEQETHLLFNLASRLRDDAVILNIGVEFGQSLACLRAGNSTAKIIGVDLDITKAVSAYECDLVQVDSHELIKEWNYPLDLIFVDGDHGTAGVLLDAKFADFLPVGGHILFQDCWDHTDYSIVHQVCPGVNGAVDKWSSREDIKQEFEELPSVASTRVFKRVKEHEQPARVADGGGAITDLPPERSSEANNKSVAKEPQVRRGSRNIRRG